MLYTIAIIFIIFRILFVCQVINHYRYALKKFYKPHKSYIPKVALILPCKGIDMAFDKNIGSFYQLDYDNYELIFVTESAEDPAYNRLLVLKDQLSGHTKSLGVSVLISGIARQGSQKLHNLLYGCKAAQKNTEVFAFADSDACIRSNWLNHLVYPLRKSKHGVSTGYRWYVPLKNNLATMALSAINARVAQMLGPTILNCAWGGSMAVRVETFEKLGMYDIWQKALSDDLTLSVAAKKANLKVIFAPGCLVSSYQKTDWKSLFEFVRRQLIITRVTGPRTWWIGFLSSLFSVLGIWGFGILAIFAYLNGLENRQIYLLTFVVFYAAQIINACLRQKMILKFLSAEAAKLKKAAAADIIGGPFWSLVLFFSFSVSVFGRTITWRGIKYKLNGPTEIIRL